MCPVGPGTSPKLERLRYQSELLRAIVVPWFRSLIFPLILLLANPIATVLHRPF
jgi:hypothetical protein